MLSKRNMAKGRVRVTFSMPALEAVQSLTLVGDFNDWNATATPLTQAAGGTWSVALTLQAGRRYQYRYLADGATWHNDWAADAYQPNEHGSENSVVDLTTTTESPAAKAPKTAKPRKSKAARA